MTRKNTRSPRKPSAPPPTRLQPRRPAGGLATTAVATSPVTRSEADFAHEYDHVRRDLTRIAVIAIGMFALILLAPRVL